MVAKKQNTVAHAKNLCHFIELSSFGFSVILIPSFRRQPSEKRLILSVFYLDFSFSAASSAAAIT